MLSNYERRLRIAHSTYTRGQMSVLYILEMHLNDKTGLTYPGVPTIMLETKLSRRYVHYCLRQFELDGVLTSFELRVGGRSRTTRYTMNFAKIPQSQAFAERDRRAQEYRVTKAVIAAKGALAGQTKKGAQKIEKGALRSTKGCTTKQVHHYTCNTNMNSNRSSSISMQSSDEVTLEQIPEQVKLEAEKNLKSDPRVHFWGNLTTEDRGYLIVAWVNREIRDGRLSILIKDDKQIADTAQKHVIGEARNAQVQLSGAGEYSETRRAI